MPRSGQLILYMNKPVWTDKHTLIIEKYEKDKKEGKIKEYVLISKDMIDNLVVKVGGNDNKGQIIPSGEAANN